MEHTQKKLDKALKRNLENQVQKEEVKTLPKTEIVTENDVSEVEA